LIGFEHWKDNKLDFKKNARVMLNLRLSNFIVRCH
jgi:hypothetical protein